AGAAPPAPVTAADIRQRAQRARLRRLDLKVVVAVAAVAALVAALLVLGPLRSTPGPAGTPGVANQPTSTSTPSTPTSTGSTTTTIPVGATSGRVYTPFTVAGAVNPSLHITSTLPAQTCEAGGVAGNSSYRCFSGNGIYDPCFAPRNATTGPLLCSTDPASDDVVELTTSSALPSALPTAPDYRNWAIELAGGQVCVQVNAAWGDLGPFSCAQSTTPGPVADCHTPVLGPSGWTAACQNTESETSPFITTTVDIVWD
ncbi:MAG: hypothetical protein ACRDY1_08875, partial [Acidimicrobiales bacterium]